MELNLDNINKIFFIGIGGISMSGLAKLLHAEGKNVLGSDLLKTEQTKSLKKSGVKVFYGHKKSHIKNCDLVVYSGAISNENSELMESFRQGIPVIERSQLLSLVSKRYKNVIAISGTHGKTTTTAMIAYIFSLCGLNPTVHVGGYFEHINGNVLIGGNEYFITEACEFRDSFLTLHPHISVINNIEKEHLDYFKTFSNEVNSFKKFACQTTQKCFVNIGCSRYIKNESIITFGKNEKSDYRAENIKQDTDGKYIFDCYNKNVYIGRFKLSIFGRHNIDNALATIAVCIECNVDYNIIRLGLKTFKNAKRRFELIGKYKNNIVIHDYAHHPTEIEKTLKTCRDAYKKKIICVFQPHTFSRTKTLIEKFSKCFKGIDELLLVKTYSAREKYDYLGSAEYLREKILQNSADLSVPNVFNKKQTLKFIKQQNFCDGIILFLGAGDIENLAYKLTKKRQ